MTKDQDALVAPTANPTSSSRAALQTATSRSASPSQTTPSASFDAVAPSAAATPKPAPTPIVHDEVVDVTTSHKFSGKKQTYTWSEVSLSFDKALYRVTGTAGRTKSCTVKWSMSDGEGRDGFTLKISPGDTKTRSRSYKSAVTEGAIAVISTCKSWSVKVSEYVPPKPKTGVYGNPWGYDFKLGKTIKDPPGAFCSYFDCIPSFWDSTNGYVVQCSDGTFSHSGGRQGVCSYHGGYRRTLHRH